MREKRDYPLITKPTPPAPRPPRPPVAEGTAAIRQRLTDCRAHAANIAKCCDEAEEAIRTRTERKLRVYVSMLYDQAVLLRVESRRAAQGVDQLPLDGLLEDSIAAVNGGETWD